MIKVLTAEQMQDVDYKSIHEYNIPSLDLMENAGSCVAKDVLAYIDKNNITNPHILVICGKGNNGGDGFVASRLLKENGIDVKTISLFKKDELKGDALINLDKLSNVMYYDSVEQFKLLLNNSNVIVDAIFGTGLNSEVKSTIKEVIDVINSQLNKNVISIDMPSGICSDTGRVLGCAIKANHTITLATYKVGNILSSGSEYCGKVTVGKIGIPQELIEDEHHKISLITKQSVAKLIPKRINNSHKGTFGKVINIVGSPNMTGAAYLSSFASLKVGAGYSFLVSSVEVIKTVSTLAPEIVHIPIEHNENDLNNLLNKIKSSNSILIGCGITTGNKVSAFIQYLINKLYENNIPAIFDADALNIISKSEDMILPVGSVLTPHNMELSRLLKEDIIEIQQNRMFYAEKAAKKFNSVVILKGSKTIIAIPDGRIYINPTGNSGLATAGTGDVLAGMIAGFKAQGLSMLDSSIVAVYLHGLSADTAVKKLTEYSLVASDLFNYIPQAFLKLEIDNIKK